MGKKRSERLRVPIVVGSHNVCALPRHDETIKQTIQQTLSVPGWRPDVVGWQEMNVDFYRNTLKSFEGYYHNFEGGGLNYSCPISVRKNFGDITSSGYRLLFKGEAKIAYDRNLEWVIVETKQGVQFALISLHQVVVKRHKLGQRRSMRRQGYKALNKVVQKFMKLGLPVAVVGDFNDRRRFFDNLVKFPGLPSRRCYAYNNRVSWVYLINGSEFKWKKRANLKVRLVNTPSDHHAILVKSKLIKK